MKETITKVNASTIPFSYITMNYCRSRVLFLFIIWQTFKHNVRYIKMRSIYKSMHLLGSNEFRERRKSVDEIRLRPKNLWPWPSSCPQTFA